MENLEDKGMKRMQDSMIKKQRKEFEKEKKQNQIQARSWMVMIKREIEK